MIQATDLVHEAYLRLLRTCDPGWDGKAHFFAAAARAMREILIEQARRKASAKHGGGRKQVAPRELAIAIEVPADDLLDLDEALQRLERDNTRAHQIVMMRFFAGLNTAETAGVLGVSVPTIERSWRYARAWLHSALTEGEGDGIKDP
jgi:RNA polymerase sigma factor (TIGR02999 family)